MTPSHLVEPWALGATLYMPATHKDLAAIFRDEKHSQVRSLVVCFEDAILESEIEAGLYNLAAALRTAKSTRQLRFIRPRNAQVLETILRISGVNPDKIDGFIIPKATTFNLCDYLKLLENQPGFKMLPTLETAEIFDGGHVRDLRAMLLPVQDRILTLRIGGNDLLNQIGMRRPKHGTIYQTPLGNIICRLVHLFKPHGFHLSAPVFEYVDRMEMLESEVEQDLMHGLTCKTAIHPDQIAVIESQYRVLTADFETAQAILDPRAPAVFKMNGAMCEPATHRRWAEQMVRRAEIYGQI